MRIAVAVELEVNDQTVLEKVTPAVVGSMMLTPSRVVRFEVHPDPDAIFAPGDEA